MPVAALLLAATLAAEPESSTVLFERDVRPILKAHCFHCHGEGGEREGGLDLRLRALIERGGDSGPALAAGKPDESYLLERMHSGDMPPGDKKPTAEEIATVERWVAAGAPTARPEPDPDSVGDGPIFTYEERNFWSFRPIERPALPRLERPRDVERVRTPVDRFVLARLAAKDLEYSADAEPEVAIRRLYLDLTGLPPTAGEVAAFAADPREDAYERLVDRLLASPRYGERWGRHWLDAAGYADSEGFTENDTERPWAWRYRDWVVEAFNDDLPYDEFLTRQLAGDELVEPPYDDLSPEEAKLLAATGFLRMAPDGTGDGGVDATVARNQVVADTIEIVGSSVMGLTVACAQCHDHRYDPIPQSDYYRLRAVLEPAYDWKAWKKPAQRRISLYTAADRATAAEIEAEAKKLDAKRSKRQAELIQKTFESELAKLDAAIQAEARKARGTPEKERTDGQKSLLRKYPSLLVNAGNLYLYDRKAADELKKMAAEAAKVRKQKPVEEYVRALTEPPGHEPTTFVFHRGDPEQPKEAVTPGGLTILDQLVPADLQTNDPELPTTGRRLALAQYLTDEEHPLTARVMVNRVWRHHFGRGIVSSAGDFGFLGAPPTHPELLDWLADEFIASGWSVKHLHRLILNSTTYRQSSERSGTAIEFDPDGRLLAGFPLQRLDAEVVRDAVLAASGSLWEKPFGPPVPVMADRVGQFVIGKENLNAGRPGDVIPLNGEEYRRSLYVQVRRSRPLGVLETFDLPAMEPNCTSRTASTVAPQALMLMNSDFLVRESTALAERLRAEVGDDAPALVTAAWQRVLGRQPGDDTLTAGVRLLEEQTAHFTEHPLPTGKEAKDVPGLPETRDAKTLALATLCQALFSSNAFLYVE